jgi:hypothetical protein
MLKGMTLWYEKEINPEADKEKTAKHGESLNESHFKQFTKYGT